MGTFENLISGVLLLFTAYSSYMLMKHRPDLFSGSNLSRSFTTIGVLALLLAGFVALLAYSLPSAGESKASSNGARQKNNVSGRKHFYDRSL